MDWNSIDLSPSHRNTLTALLNKYEGSDTPVKSSEVAAQVNRTERSVKNQMRKLSTLNLVEGYPGPTGGYRPTEKAFNALERDRGAERETVVLSQEFDRVDVTVEKIRFQNVHHPNECLALVHFRNMLEQIGVGDEIAVGPTPQFDLQVVGHITEILGPGDKILIDVGRMIAPFTGEEISVG